MAFRRALCRDLYYNAHIKQMFTTALFHMHSITAIRDILPQSDARTELNLNNQAQYYLNDPSRALHSHAAVWIQKLLHISFLKLS